MSHCAPPIFHVFISFYLIFFDVFFHIPLPSSHGQRPPIQPIKTPRFPRISLSRHEPSRARHENNDGDNGHVNPFRPKKRDRLLPNNSRLQPSTNNNLQKREFQIQRFEPNFQKLVPNNPSWKKSGHRRRIRKREIHNCSVTLPILRTRVWRDFNHGLA